MKYISPSLILLIIMLTGFALRLYDLDGENLWVDEGHAVHVASLDIAELIYESSRDNHPPLYSILLHYWMKLVPNTIYHLRLLSAIFGALSLFFIYKVGAELFNKTVAQISSLILAFSVFHIQYSQEIRSYMLFVVLILVSYFLLIRFIKTTRIIYLFLYILFTTLLIYTHFIGWFIFLAQNIYFLLRPPFDKHRIKPFLIVNLIIILLFIPWLNILISRFYGLQAKFWVSEPTYLSIPQTFLVFAGTYTIYGIILFIIFCILIFLCFFVYRERKVSFRGSDNHENYFLLLWLLIPILVPFVISLISAPIYIIRITIGASLAFYLLSAYGLSLIDRNWVKTGIVILILILSIGNLGIYYSETNKERWQEATEFVESKAQSGDLLIFHAGFGLDKAFNYYAKRNDLEKRRFPEIGYEVDQHIVNGIIPLLRDKKNVWLILTHSQDDENLIIKKLSVGFELISHKEYVSYSYNSHKPYVGIEVFQFQRFE